MPASRPANNDAVNKVRATPRSDVGFPEVESAFSPEEHGASAEFAVPEALGVSEEQGVSFAEVVGETPALVPSCPPKRFFNVARLL